MWARSGGYLELLKRGNATLKSVQYRRMFRAVAKKLHDHYAQPASVEQIVPSANSEYLRSENFTQATIWLELPTLKQAAKLCPKR